jgi:serine/threonine-protein kinase RsbW
MTGEFAKGLEALDAIFEFLGEFGDRYQLDEQTRLCLDLVAEELFTNTVKYGSGRGDRVIIRIEKAGRQLRLEVVDRDAEPFDPSSVKPLAPGAPIEERRPGGLGLHLVRSLVDRVDYDYQDRELRISVTKNLER